MKTIKEWLNELPEINRSLALDNHEKQPFFFKGQDIDCLSDALDLGFEWNKTHEGFNYWEDFHNDLLEQEANTKTI